MKRGRADKKNKQRRPHPTAFKQARIRARFLTERVSLLWTGSVFLLHALGIALLFKPLEGIVNNAPIIEQDWALHFHHLRSLETFWREDHLFWGYNPLFMAGYPSNTLQDLSIKFFEFAALALSSVALTPVQWFKIVGFLVFASVPWMTYFAARNFFERTDIKNLAAFIAALIGTASWWNSLPREMFFYGMLGYPAACYATVLGISLFYRLARESSTAGVQIAWLLFAVAILPLHIQAVMIFLPPAAALLLADHHWMRGSFVASIIGAAVLTLLANYAWLSPAFQHRNDEVTAAMVNQLPLFTNADPLIFIKDYFQPKSYWSFRTSLAEKGFRLALLILGAWGIIKMARTEQKSLAMSFAAGSTILFFITYFGSMIPLLRPWQPLRFKVAYDLSLILPAAYILALRFAPNAALPSPNLVAALLAAGGLSLTVNLAQTESRGAMQLRTRMAPELREISDWIAREAPPEARVLFEESGDETGFVYDGSYLSSFIPHWTGRQLIGGPINVSFDRHHFAEFHSGKLFQRDIRTLTDEEIRDYFRRYNIGAVVSFHPWSIQRLRSVPGLVVLDRQVGPVHLMKVNQPLSWFLRGAGEVKAKLNRIELTALKGSEVILKYHWITGLVGIPEVKVVPVQIGDDPIPFIKLIDPPATLTLRVVR